MKTLLFTQDDCAPDSFGWFETELKKETGLSVYDFKMASSSMRVFASGFAWTFKGYYLEIHADDPFYKLYRKEW